ADDVYLKNGRKFEGVIAETTESQVRIRLPGGVLSLPKSQVLRIETGRSTLSEYLVRKEALRRGADTRAQDWLDLSRWARTEGMEQGAREAALIASELDPALEGLAPVLRSFRYVYNEQMERWISYEDSMRQRGFVFSGGVWISREEIAERDRQREADMVRRRAEAEAARSERAARQTELLLATQNVLLNETVRDRRQRDLYPYIQPYGWPVVVIPGYFPSPGHHGSGNPDGSGGGGGGTLPEPPSQPRPARDGHGGFIRVPGSLIPGNAGNAGSTGGTGSGSSSQRP
ncbi:MAG: hypothetical protein ABUL63_05730, partial [Acidobacteriota bacterium]